MSRHGISSPNTLTLLCSFNLIDMTRTTSQMGKKSDIMKWKSQDANIKIIANNFKEA
jgi:hypothetical protein